MINLPAALDRHNEPPDERVTYAWGWIIALSFLPGLAQVGFRQLLTPVHGLGYEVVWTFYFLAEVLILIAFMWAVGRREGSLSLRSLVPYNQPVGLKWFLALLVASTALAIFFRDFFQSDWLNDLATLLRSALTGWPPAVFPENNSFVEGLSGWRLSLFSLIGTLTIVAASGMQTLYFRGFILPRMPRLGWWTVIFNCVFFSMYHLSSPWFWGHFLLYTFIWGVVTHMTRNVWIAVVSHMIFNSYAVILGAFGI